MPDFGVSLIYPRKRRAVFSSENVHVQKEAVGSLASIHKIEHHLCEYGDDSDYMNAAAHVAYWFFLMNYPGSNMTQMLLHLSKDCLFVRLLSNLMGTLPHIKFSLIRFILCIFFVRINPRTPRNSVWLGGFVVKKFVWCSALGRAQLFAF